MNLLADLRYALRGLRRSPAFTVTAIITLALGIGANTAIYSLLDQVMLRSLPVRDPGQLVMLSGFGSDRGRLSMNGGTPEQFFSYPMYRDLRAKNSVFSGLLAAMPVRVGVQWKNQPELVDGEMVSGNYFDVLGVNPAIGRLFQQSEDEVQERNPVVVLSYGYWQRRFGLDPRIVDSSILVNGHPFTVIGVAPPGFKSVTVGAAPDVFAPMMMKPEITPGWNDLDNRRSRWLNIIGRLKPGVTLQQAQVQLAPLWHSLREDELKQMPNATPKFRVGFLDKSHLDLLDSSKGFSPLREQIAAPLLIVMAMAGLVVLIACANVAGLLLVKAAGRVREMSVRYALGASRSRVVQQLVIEGIVLGVAGGALGLLLAPGATHLLLRKLWTDSTGQVPFSAGIDARLLCFDLGISLLVGLLFSLAPAWQFWRPNLVDALKQQINTASGGQLNLRRATVAVQIAFSLMLLFGAGLFVRTLRNLRNVNVGFATDHLLTFAVAPGLAGYPANQNTAVYKRILDTLTALPGARSVAGTDDPELSGDNESSNITVPGYIPSENERTNVEWAQPSPNYFKTLGIPLLLGRDFRENDSSANVAVVNEAFAKHYFGSAQNALGRTFARGGGANRGTPLLTVIGVVADAKHADLRTPVAPNVYSPYSNPDAKIPRMQFYVRTWQAPEAAMNTIRTAMQNLDSKMVIDGMETMDQQIGSDLSTESIIAFLAVSFGILATFLAAVGLYGVLAYSTAQRTREIGIRMALGASRASVVSMVLREVAWLAGISIAVALPASLLLARYLRSQLYGVSNADPLTLIAVVVLIGLVAVLAALVPARRAAGVNPTRALRYE
ncbi:MAG TPA: ABC transporter permease [Terriglobales bacterium]|nr:ABC transporter permease [Terriglobales bacterium]